MRNLRPCRCVVSAALHISASCEPADRFKRTCMLRHVHAPRQPIMILIPPH